VTADLDFCERMSLRNCGLNWSAAGAGPASGSGGVLGITTSSKIEFCAPLSRERKLNRISNFQGPIESVTLGRRVEAPAEQAELRNLFVWCTAHCLQKSEASTMESSG
jgi:hypothetical protein